MIYNVLKILKRETSNYFGSSDYVVLDNIAKLGDNPDGAMNNKVVLSLLSTEEESTLKNKMSYEVVNGQAVYKSRPAYLNMYIMFTANRTNYEKSLQDISRIIEFFQERSVYSNVNTQALMVDPGLEPPNSKLDSFKFKVNLHSLPFEQLSYAWGVLGGKVMPSALFKVSVIELDRDRTTKKKSLIDSIIGKGKTI